MEALAVAIELHGLGRRLVGLRDEHRIRVVGVHEGANLLHKLDGLRQGLAAYTVAFKEVSNGIKAQAVQSLVHPEGQDLEHLLLHGRVIVVQIRLVGVEAVEVVLAALVIPSPIGGLHVGENDTDFGVALRVIAPNIEIAIGAGGIRAGGLEPRVVGAGVIERQIRHNAHAAAVQLRNELFKVLHRAVIRMDGVVVRDIVAIIAQGAGIKRREPQAVHAEPLEVIQLIDDPAQRAYLLIAIGLKGADEGLVEDGIVVPAHERSFLFARQVR